MVSALVPSLVQENLTIPKIIQAVVEENSHQITTLEEAVELLAMRLVTIILQGVMVVVALQLVVALEREQELALEMELVRVLAQELVQVLLLGQMETSRPVDQVLV